MFATTLIVSHFVQLNSLACVPIIVPKNSRFLTLSIHIIAPVLHVHQNTSCLVIPHHFSYPSMHVTLLRFQFLLSIPLSTCSTSSISTTDDNSNALVIKYTCGGKIIHFKFSCSKHRVNTKTLLDFK